MDNFLTIFQNGDLLSVGIAVAGMVLMGFAVLFNSTKNVSNRIFFYLTLTAAIWGTVNYISYQPFSPAWSLWLLRAVMFFAVWSSFFTFAFAYIFPEETFKFTYLYKRGLVLLTAVTSLMTLTPLVFSRIIEFQDGHIIKVANGPGIVIFAAVVVLLNVGSMLLLIRKIRAANNEQRKPLRIIAYGFYLMLFLIVGFNFILPAFFDITRFISLGALFMLPFIIFTSYAILKHRMFNIRIAGTALLVFALSVVIFSEIILSPSMELIIFRSSIFVLILIFGVLLIRSVLKEVQQREELQILSEKLKEANIQLELLDKARAEFISIASHQLRTPPATIKWYVGAILTGDFGELTPDLKAALERVNVTNNSQISLIDDLLNASRIERGKLEFFFELGDLNALAELTVEQLKPQAGMKKLELEYHKPATPVPMVMVDKEKVRQVINNFIDNAIKYTKEGKIDVLLEQTATDILVKVKDSGRGVDPETTATLFQKYQRGKDSATVSSGLGLGLYVAKVIIEQNHGKIWVESEGAGKGSTFIFSIPIKSTLKETSVVDLVEQQNQNQR